MSGGTAVRPGRRTVRVRQFDLRGAADRLWLVDPGRPVPWTRWLLAVLAVGGGTVLSLLRQAGAGALDTLWAEDGRVFLADAAARSTLDALATPYGGYFNTVPRLLAEVMVWFPADRAAAVAAVEAAVVTSVLALVVFTACRSHLTEVPLRLLVSVPMVVVPVGMAEVPNSISYLHWPLLYTSLWMFVWVPASRTGRLVATAVVVLTVLSDLLALVFVPLAVARWYVRRDRHSALLAGVLVVGLGLQFGTMALGVNQRGPAFAPPRPDPVWALLEFVLRPVPQAVLGERLVSGRIDAGYLPVAMLGWLVVAAVVVVALRRLSRPDWPLAAVLAGGALALYVESLIGGGQSIVRYAVAPALMTLAALAALVRPARDDRPGRWKSVPMYALVGLLTVVCAVNLRTHNARADGPPWHTTLAEARAVCAGLPPDAV
ncbi:hypothetical protein ACFQ0D_12515, partial [Micromonospora zhanjiangensis]